MGSLINDLAMVSRADREKFVQSWRSSIHRVLASLQHDYAEQATKKGLEIKLEGQPVPKLFGSPAVPREVLQNFVTNALKYTERAA